MGVVGDKHIVGNHLFHNRMPAFLNINDAFLVDLRADIIIPLRHKSKGGKGVQSSHRFRCLLDPLHFCCDGIPHMRVDLILQRV